MGTCCEAHLITMVRSYHAVLCARRVTVWILENPPEGADSRSCAYCKAPAAFKVTIKETKLEKMIREAYRDFNYPYSP